MASLLLVAPSLVAPRLRHRAVVATASSASLEADFLRALETVGARAAECADALEAATQVPETPDALAERVLGYWRLAFTSGADTFTEAGLSGLGAGDQFQMLAHFQRFATTAPEAQTVELIGDAAVGKARVATLKGSYSAADGLVRTKQRGLVGRLFRRSKYDFAPSIEEAYDELEFDGAIETGFRWFRRTWVCTFLGERVRVCREEGGGLAVYDRMEEGEALREIERISTEPFGFEAMARQMLEQMQRGGMGGMGGPGGGGGFPPGLMDGDFRGRGDFDGPSQRSSIP